MKVMLAAFMDHVIIDILLVNLEEAQNHVISQTGMVYVPFSVVTRDCRSRLVRPTASLIESQRLFCVNVSP